MNKKYDIVILGNYTKDTIVSAAGTRYVDGGGFNYGAYAAAKSGLKVAAVTRLASEDNHVVKALEDIGVDVYPTYTESSTLMRLEYPTDNVDERVLSAPITAGSYSPEQFFHLEAKAYLINASVRSEVPFDVVKYLSKRNGLVVADVQGFVRIVGKNDILINAEWPEKRKILALIDILKADAVEAESLTGERDLHKAAKGLAGWGPKEIVLTHRNGVLVYAGDEFYEATFHPGSLVGRSGRGDTCIAAYAAKRLSGPPEEAIIWSAALTSLKMEVEGPFTGELNDVLRLIREKYGD
ncbi:MAG: hypothetical protein IIA61_13620 [Candidatus Marinimicrobia bacterium]|nr:hypothetical protein [Candidatus Neomarinimicrobiota bacterium]